MKINDIVWERVEITCPKHTDKNRILRNATVNFSDGEIKINSSSSGDNVSYIRAKICELTSVSFKATGCWWSSYFNGKWRKRIKTLPVTIQGEF